MASSKPLTCGPKPPKGQRALRGLSRVPAVCVSVASIVVVASSASAQGLNGIVVDPQERRVVGADIRLTCAGEGRRAASDEQGRFAFDPHPGIESCVLSVTAAGFTAVTEVVGRRQSPWVVRLSLQPLVETIEVRAPAEALRARLGAHVLSSEDLREISDDPREILRYARSRAGSGGDYAVYVDGLPSDRLPPVSRTASVAVNPDPFSAEYSDAGSRRIEIQTTEPDRRWHVNVAGAPPTVGAGNPLAPDNHSRSRSLSGNVAGPLPWAGASFVFGGALDGSREQPAIVAVVPGASGSTPGALEVTSSRRMASLQFQQQIAGRTTLRVDGRREVDGSANAGVGGEVLREAGSSIQSREGDVRVTIAHSTARLVWRNWVAGTWRDQATMASSGGLGVWLPGAFVGGGAPTRSARTDLSAVLWKSAFGSAPEGREWRAGFTMQRVAAGASQTPNAAGHVEFSPDAWAQATRSATGNYFRLASPTSQRAVLSDAAGFAELSILARPRGSLKGGVRVDWQSRDRAYFSPRLSGTVRAGSWRVDAGIGMFTRMWRPELFLGTRAAAGEAPVQLMWRQASADDVTEVPGESIETDFGAGFTRARFMMASGSAERRIGPLTFGVEHTWWRGRHLPGARRLSEGAGAWLDRVESDRVSDSHELRTRLEAGGRRGSIALSYGWIHAVDDSDGAFSFPARQDDLEAERSRSARVPADSIDVVAAGNLPGGVRATCVVTVRGASPYNIVSGIDAEGNGLATDRAGLPRNSGDGPTYRTVSVYLHRRFDLGALLGAGSKLPLDAGVQIDNALGTSNWTAIGNVLGSPLFGRPEGALPGRSLRVWFAVAR